MTQGVALGPVPSWIIEFLTPRPGAPTGKRSAADIDAADRPPVGALLRWAMKRLAKGHGRNDTGFALACQLRDNGYSQDEAQVIILDYCEQANAARPADSKGEIAVYRTEEATASVASAYKEAPREPWAGMPHHQAGEAHGNGKGAVPPPARIGARPQIIASNRQLPEITTEAVSALVADNDAATDTENAPVLYTRGFEIARVRTDADGNPQIEAVSEPALRGRLARAADWYAYTKKGEMVAVGPPVAVVRDILALGAWPALPPLAAVIETPALRPDGTVITTPGYDRATRLLYRPASCLTVPDVPNNPTWDERSAAIMTAARDHDQWRKRLTTLLRNGASIIVIDNIEDCLDSPDLAAVLTARVWEDRLLGTNQSVAVPQRAAWIGTGNNITLGGDLPRRCYWVRMDPKMSRPWERDGFQIPDLLEWVSANRGNLIAALLTLSRGWYAVGRPDYRPVRLGSYEGWCAVVGNIMHHYGLTDFLGNRKELYERGDTEGPQWEAFLSAWAAEFGDAPRTVAEIWQ